MITNRISLAIANGDIALPEAGRTVVFRARNHSDIDSFPKDRTLVVQGFKPDHDALERAGFDTAVAPEGKFSCAVVFLPRSKSEARGLIAQASGLADGGLVIVDGQKTDGIESFLKDCKKAGAQICATFSKAHGKLFAFTGGEFSKWLDLLQETKLQDGFVTLPGLFSADEIDKGSAALVQALPDTLKGKVCDLGAGWGYLSHHVLKNPNVSECHLVEAEHAALECARKNVQDDRAKYHWADATRFESEADFDAVVMNPPFHVGRSADPALGRAFIATTARLLKPRGTVWLVANRHLPYEAALTEAFLEVEEVSGSPSFKVFCASKPRRKKR